MSKLIQIPIFFASIDSLINIYKKHEDIDIKNLGIIIGKKSIVSQVLYKEKEIIRTPYGIKVNPTSYRPRRETIARYIIDMAITKYQLGLTESTINGTILNIVHFVDWLNNNNMELDDNIKKATEIFREYTVYLKSQIRNNIQQHSTSAAKQIDVYKMLQQIYNDKTNIIGSSVSFIPREKSANRKTEKSPKEEQKYHYKFHYEMFHQITDFILEEKSFPVALKLVDKHYWCVPSRKLFYKENDTNYPYAFNKKTGEIKSKEEIAIEYDIKRKNAYFLRNSFIKTLEKYNKPRSRTKLFLATYALKAFYILFIANTGINDSTASTLKWNDEFKIEKKRHRFKNIKYRADNKVVEFEIGNSFIKDFEKFLKLRAYILGEKKMDFLFFLGSGDTASVSPRQKQGTFSSVISRRFNKFIDSDLPIITSRKLRVNKTYQTIKKHGIIAASQLAQTSIGSLMEHYQGTTDEIMEKEFENYFEYLNKTLVIDEKDSVETAIGWCNDLDNPKQSTVLSDSLTGCSSKEGCLFCENYRIHMDKQDINKLFSLKFIIHECRYIAASEEHFNKIYGVVLKRIDNIIEKIISKKVMTVQEIDTLHYDVFENENLHPFWEHKLNTLLAMGVLK